MTNLGSGAHVVFSIHLHIVFVTKYRRKVLTKSMISDMKGVFERQNAVRPRAGFRR